MAALAADRQREMLALGVVLSNNCAGFHVVGDDARIDDRNFRDGVSILESSLSFRLVTDRGIEQHIARMIRPDSAVHPS